MEQKRVLLIDNGHRTAASMSAAGIINPITGKRLNRPYLIDQLLEHAFAIYPRLERFLGASFFRRRKGELLTLRTPGFADDRIIQRGKWLYRASADELKAGTTYSWDRLDETPTNAGRKEIEDSLGQFANIDYEVVDHTAGVRPVIRVDNRPVIGTHPDNNRIAIFNGLGSKGALQAPFAAVQLIGYLEGSQTIHREFDVCRKSLWQRPSSD